MTKFKKLTVKRIIIVVSGILLLWLLVGALSGLKCYYDTKAWYHSATKNKLIRLYASVLFYADKYGEYPPCLTTLVQDEITEEQNINDMKPIEIFGPLVAGRSNPIRFLYDDHLKLNQKHNDHENQIIVAEPMAVDNMRYVIYTQYINKFANHKDEIKKNPELRTSYFEKVDDSVKRIPESEFQEQAKIQNWNVK